jgi:beta-lactamase class D
MENRRDRFLKITMRLSILLFCCGVFFVCGKKSPDLGGLFAGKDGCLLLMNLKSGTMEQEWNPARCRERLPACSTFKVPLALMAFDSGILRDEKQLLRWDGKKRLLDAWNRDHNAATWMQESVVWFSQRLTPLIGAARIQEYLKDFHYGNEDLSGGVTDAWLHAPDSAKAALNISAYEQVEFMRAFWNNRLRVKPRAIALTKKITYLETSPAGFVLSGKTGSNFYDADKKKRLGWFIGHQQKNDQEYLVVTNFSDREDQAETIAGGRRAKEIAKAFLETRQLW